MAESERLDELISNLLILAKKESQLDDIPRTPIHINELLGNIIQPGLAIAKQAVLMHAAALRPKM